MDASIRHGDEVQIVARQRAVLVAARSKGGRQLRQKAPSLLLRLAHLAPIRSLGCGRFRARGAGSGRTSDGARCFVAHQEHPLVLSFELHAARLPGFAAPVRVGEEPEAAQKSQRQSQGGQKPRRRHERAEERRRRGRPRKQRGEDFADADVPQQHRVKPGDAVQAGEDDVVQRCGRVQPRLNFRCMIAVSSRNGRRCDDGARIQFEAHISIVRLVARRLREGRLERGLKSVQQGQVRDQAEVAHIENVQLACGEIRSRHHCCCGDRPRGGLS
mmetsp:Transcript_38295/g.97167  ORF Transcript_38295/g.97167 Transcript_38295/m.97167 type:complete len:273 (+) Transcript_38295:290-1108(+)